MPLSRESTALRDEEHSARHFAGLLLLDESGHGATAPARARGAAPVGLRAPTNPRGLGIRCRRASEQCDLDAGVEGELVDQAGRTEGSASGAEQIFHCALERFGVVFAADQGVEHEPVESGERSGRSLGP